jgi:hypothetical protein
MKNHIKNEIAYSTKKLKELSDRNEELRSRMYMYTIPPTEAFSLEDRTYVATALTELAVHVGFLAAAVEDMENAKLMNRLKRLFKK